MMTNSELIALDQDPMGQQAEFIGETDGIQIYAKDLENGDVAIAVLNLNDTERVATINFSDIPALESGGKYLFRDLWAKENLGIFRDRYSVSVASHETKVYRLESVKN